jgi:hypothetical protein
MTFHLRLADFLKSLITVGAEAQKILDMYNSMSGTDRASNLSKFSILEPTKCIGRPPTKLSSIVQSVKTFPKSTDSEKIELPNKQPTPVAPAAASSSGNQSDSNDDLFDENHTKAKSFLFQVCPNIIPLCLFGCPILSKLISFSRGKTRKTLSVDY